MYWLGAVVRAIGSIRVLSFTMLHVTRVFTCFLFLLHVDAAKTSLFLPLPVRLQSLQMAVPLSAFNMIKMHCADLPMILLLSSRKQWQILISATKHEFWSSLQFKTLNVVFQNIFLKNRIWISAIWSVQYNCKKEQVNKSGLQQSFRRTLSNVGGGG